MDIVIAKKIHGTVMKVLMHTQGIGGITEDDVIAVKEVALPDMLKANALMSGHKEVSDDGCDIHFVGTTDEALAELYLRLHDKEFMVASELEEMCDAMDESFATVNGHGVLIDGVGNYSLIEISRCGTSADKTLFVGQTPREIYNYIKSVVND